RSSGRYSGHTRGPMATSAGRDEAPRGFAAADCGAGAGPAGAGGGDVSTNWDSRWVMSMLPHRYPFLLIDRVLEIDPTRRIVALKNVTINEEFFMGHFPDNPVMPGVLIIEALAQ